MLIAAVALVLSSGWIVFTPMLGVRLTVDGKTYTQSLRVKMDPRVKTPALVMQQVYSLTRTMYFGAVDGQAAAARMTPR